MKKIIIILSVIVMITNCAFNVNAAGTKESDITIVFTHDLHSHIEPYDSNANTVGGFSRIKTIIDRAKSNYKNTIVLDAGDFSMCDAVMPGFINCHTHLATSALRSFCDDLSGHEALDAQLSRHRVTFVWVKGHADNPYNNRCDELAVAQTKKHM